MNCFTLEASFHGYIDKDRTTAELTTEALEEMGKVLGVGIHEYSELVEEDDRQRYWVREQIKSKKKKIKARDIAKAMISKQEKAVR